MGDHCFSSLLIENYQEVSRRSFNNLFFLLNMDLSVKISVLDIFRSESCIYETEKISSIKHFMSGIPLRTSIKFCALP